jgi:hypothetical protein
MSWETAQCVILSVTGRFERPSTNPRPAAASSDTAMLIRPMFLRLSTVLLSRRDRICSVEEIGSFAEPSGNRRCVGEPIALQQCFEFSHSRIVDRHRHSSLATERQSFLDSEHLAERHRLQHLSWRYVGRTLLENQFGSKRQHSLFGHYCCRRTDLLLRNDLGQFDERRESLLQSDNGRDSTAIVGAWQDIVTVGGGRYRPCIRSHFFS